MDIQEAIKVLEAFNDCRTQEFASSPLPDAEKITIALDLAIDKLKNLPIHDLTRKLLPDVEEAERRMLLRFREDSNRWFSREEFNRLKELNEKVYKNAGYPHCL